MEDLAELTLISMELKFRFLGICNYCVPLIDASPRAPVRNAWQDCGFIPLLHLWFGTNAAVVLRGSTRDGLLIGLLIWFMIYSERIVISHFSLARRISTSDYW